MKDLGMEQSERKCRVLERVLILRQSTFMSTMRHPEREMQKCITSIRAENRKKQASGKRQNIWANVFRQISWTFTWLQAILDPIILVNGKVPRDTILLKNMHYTDGLWWYVFPINMTQTCEH